MPTWNAIDILKADHTRIENIYRHYQQMGGSYAERRTVIDDLCQALMLHAQLEEEMFYPLVLPFLDQEGSACIYRGAQAHAAFKSLIWQIQQEGIAESERHILVNQLMYHVQQHVREEEDEVLPRVARTAGQEMEALGQHMQERRQALSRTPY